VRLYAAIAIVALACGTAAWWLFERPRPTAPGIAPAALWAATFPDASGQPVAIGQFRGRVIVANFWATWCAPCREEIPVLAAAQSQWGARGVQVLGLTSDDPAAVARFAAEFKVNYPLLVGRTDVDELGRRLGNAAGVLPFTAVLDGEGRVLTTKVGAYSSADLAAVVSAATAKLQR
jgi:thiol-disulfide isomerase/thioredoxin